MTYRRIFHTTKSQTLKIEALVHRNSDELYTNEDSMNTYSFVGQSHRTGHHNRFTKTAMAKAHGTINYLQKRWYSKQSNSAQKPLQQETVVQPKALMPASISGENNHALLRQKALAEAKLGRYAEAIDLFSYLINQNPDNASHYSNRGLVYFQRGQAEAALADYNRAIELNPRLDSTYNNRANYYAAQGQFLEAILDYDVALDLNPTNTRAWINQGITFRELEMYDRALESLDLALCLGQLEGHVYAERGRTYHLRGDWNCAVADYQRALAELPQSIVSQNPSTRLRQQVEKWLNDLVGSLI